MDAWGAKSGIKRLQNASKKLEKVTFWIFLEKSMFWQALDSVKYVSTKNKNHHLGRTTRAKS